MGRKYDLLRRKVLFINKGFLKGLLDGNKIQNGYRLSIATEKQLR